MSNYTDFLTLWHQANDPTAEQHSSLELFGAALGAAADISGAIGLVLLGIQLIDMIVGKTDDGNAQLSAQLNALTQAQRTRDYLDRLRALDKSISPAQTAHRPGSPPSQTSRSPIRSSHGANGFGRIGLRFRVSVSG